MVHDVKCWPEFFEPMIKCFKKFEVRKNDRGYKVGDKLIIREFRPLDQTYTGRAMTMSVEYILEGGNFGLKPGHVIMCGEIKIGVQP